MASYLEWQSKVLAPPWLRGPVARRFQQVLGLVKDLVVAGVKDAVKVRFVGLAPLDALPYLGTDRNIERYPAEDDTTYRARLTAAWSTWEFAGTPDGIVHALRAAGVVGPIDVLNVRNGPPGVVPWPPDGDLANWSRFWIQFSPPLPFDWQARRWGDGHRWGDGWTWGSTATREQIAFVRAIVRKWKPAHEICAGIRVLLPDGRGGVVAVMWAGME